MSNREYRNGRTVTPEGTDFLESCLYESDSEFGKLQIFNKSESALWNAGWRVWDLGDRFRWVKIGKQYREWESGRTVTVSGTVSSYGGQYWTYDEVITDEYETSQRTKSEVIGLFFSSSVEDALKQLWQWQFQFKPVETLKKYSALFIGCGVFVAAALWGKYHG